MAQLNPPREGNGNRQPEEEWKRISDLCNERIQDLGSRWRIHDQGGQGVLFATGGRRLIGDPLPQALVDEENLQREVGLSYALFNARSRLELPDNCRFISWEAPLLRSTENIPRAPRVRCDLIAYDADAKTLVAVEVKFDPNQEDTNIQSGLLQAIEYGYILDCARRSHGFALEQQVQQCLNVWCGEEDPERTIEKITYTLAAPEEYFRHGFQAPVQATAISDWIEKLIKCPNISFDGFWVIDSANVEPGMQVDDLGYVPIIDCKVRRVHNAKDLPGYSAAGGSLDN